MDREEIFKKASLTDQLLHQQDRDKEVQGDTNQSIIGSMPVWLQVTFVIIIIAAIILTGHMLLKRRYKLRQRQLAETTASQNKNLQENLNYLKFFLEEKIKSKKIKSKTVSEGFYAYAVQFLPKDVNVSESITLSQSLDEIIEIIKTWKQEMDAAFATIQKGSSKYELTKIEYIPEESVSIIKTKMRLLCNDYPELLAYLNSPQVEVSLKRSNIESIKRIIKHMIDKMAYLESNRSLP